MNEGENEELVEGDEVIPVLQATIKTPDKQLEKTGTGPQEVVPVVQAHITTEDEQLDNLESGTSPEEVVQAVRSVKSTPGGSPPNGAPAGGVWGSGTYYGAQSTMASVICCLLGGFFSGTVFCCVPHDKRRVYRVNGRYYTPSGRTVGCRTFVGGDLTTGETDGDACCMGWGYATLLTFVVFIIFFFFPM